MFELYDNDCGVKIKCYNADYGRFADNGFIEACKLGYQGITYCGVNAHFQNGIAKKRIRDGQETARTSILFAIHKWPKMVNIHLWPYALRTANKVMISTPGDLSSIKLFTGVKVAPKLKHFHTFGCPTYV